MEEMKSEELRVFTVMERFLDKGLEKVEGEITFDVMIKQIRKAERELVKAKVAYEAEKAVKAGK